MESEIGKNKITVIIEFHTLHALFRANFFKKTNF
jgi:hypothetical protein